MSSQKTPPPQKKGTAPPARDSPRAPYLYRGGVEAASGRLNQRQSSTFSWRQIRTGPSIRHGLKVRDDGSNMKTDGRSPEGGGGGRREESLQNPRGTAQDSGPRCDNSRWWWKRERRQWREGFFFFLVFLSRGKFRVRVYGAGLCHVPLSPSLRPPRSLNLSRGPLRVSAASRTHASLKAASSCSANHGSGEAGHQTRNVPQLTAAPGEGRGGREARG